MGELRGKRAVVVGGSSGIGKATVKALLQQGAAVTAVARGAERLRALEAELGAGLTTVQGDAARPELAQRLLRELQPELLVLAAGVTPTMASLESLAWADFSQAWEADVQGTFHFLTQALLLPLPRGATVVVVSSGAALNGSPLSGGYAGAKRMQWWLAEYAQRVSDAKQLGLRVLAVLPDQLVEGTTIGERAATVYGAQAGLTAAAFMKRFEAPLDVDTVAAAVLGALRGEVATGVKAIAVRGAQTRALP